MIAAAVGGENIGETIEGRARFPISVRYPRELRDSVEAVRMLPVVTQMGAQIPLSALASVRVVEGPPMLQQRERAPVGLDLRRRAGGGARLGRA